MPVCPRCSSPLEEFRNKLVCTADVCDFVITKTAYAARSSPWFQRLYEDESLWHKPAFEQAPAIIAHEYWRIHDLLRQEKPYGAFMQIKDTFEVLLKFPMLIAASILAGQQTRSEADTELLSSLFQQKLALGHWETIARQVCKRQPAAVPATILKLLHDVTKKCSIVNWRNDKIGHGALAFDADEQFQEDLADKLTVLRDHFQRCVGLYAQCTCYLLRNGQQQLLCGKAAAQQLCPSNEDALVLRIGTADYPLSPFLLLHNQGIYFFDHYQIKPQNAAVLNYVTGHKAVVNHPEVTRLYDILSKTQIFTQFTAERTEQDQVFLTQEARTLEQIARIDDFQRPEYLIEWLRHDILSTHSKGIFLLQMERGAGKSTFVRGVDPRSIGKIKLRDMTVKAYYLNDAYFGKAGIFISEMDLLLRMGADGKPEIRGELPALSAASENKARDFAGMLNFYRNAYQAVRQQNKLLLVIDGLDEIPTTETDSIFDFLPADTDLDEGVYVLLTCRTDQELDRLPFIANRLKALSLTAPPLCISRQDQRYQNVLRAYIREKLNRTDQNRLNQHEINAMLVQTDHRFLYLKMVKEILKINPEPDIIRASDKTGLFATFLNELKSLYEEKFFEGVLQILIILATALEPLTLGEIAYLTGEAAPSFRLLAYLTDLRGFLRIERNYRGSQITIAHAELQELILAKYHERIQMLVQKWLQTCRRVNANEVEIEDDGLICVLAHALDYTVFTGNTRQTVLTPEFCNLLSVVAYKLQASQQEHHRERALHLYTAAIQIHEQMRNSDTSDDQQALSDFARVLMNRATAYGWQQRLEEAIQDFTRALEIQEQLLAEGRLADARELAQTYGNRGIAHNLLEQRTRAIDDYTKAIHTLREAELSPPQELAWILINRGGVHTQIGDIQAALDDFDQALDLLQPIQQDETADETDKARAFMYRGIARTKQKHPAPDKVIEDFNNAIRIQEQQRKDDRLFDESELAWAVLHRGVARREQHLFDRALKDFKCAIRIQTRLKEAGRLLDDHDLALSFMHRGLTYQAVQQPKAAMADLARAWEIIKPNLLQKRRISSVAAQVMFHAVAVPHRAGYRNAAETVWQEIQKFFGSNKLTEEARYWQDQLQQLATSGKSRRCEHPCSHSQG